jgi:hypothetical protein
MKRVVSPQYPDEESQGRTKRPRPQEVNERKRGRGVESPEISRKRVCGTPVTVVGVEQVKWSAALGQSLIETVKRREKRRKERVVFQRISEKKTPTESSKSGRALLEDFDAAFRYLFERSEVRLGALQKRIVDLITIALLGKFFKHDLVANLKRLRRKYLIEELNDTVSAICPRRSGKTEACAMTISVIAVSQPNGNSVMYNLTGMQAKEFLNSVITYLKVWLFSSFFENTCEIGLGNFSFSGCGDPSPMGPRIPGRGRGYLSTKSTFMWVLMFYPYSEGPSTFFNFMWKGHTNDRNFFSMTRVVYVEKHKVRSFLPYSRRVHGENFRSFV